MKVFVEEVFVTEGVPQFTFVPPPNFNEIFLDLRRPGKPLIIEGQSGTGKTTCIIKAIEKLGTAMSVVRLSSRRANDISTITRLISKKPEGIFLVDDFHRLDTGLQSELANIAKLAAEEGEAVIRLPKLILVGINQVGSTDPSCSGYSKKSWNSPHSSGPRRRHTATNLGRMRKVENKDRRLENDLYRKPGRLLAHSTPLSNPLRNK
jgi:hypothetical protein